LKISPLIFMINHTTCYLHFPSGGSKSCWNCHICWRNSTAKRLTSGLAGYFLHRGHECARDRMATLNTRACFTDVAYTIVFMVLSSLCVMFVERRV